MKPAPGSAIRDRTPLIAATVSDADTELAQSNMRLFVDGRARAFSYNADTDRLSRLSNRLAYGRHTVRDRGHRRRAQGVQKLEFQNSALAEHVTIVDILEGAGLHRPSPFILSNAVPLLISAEITKRRW